MWSSEPELKDNTELELRFVSRVERSQRSPMISETVASYREGRLIIREPPVEV